MSFWHKEITYFIILKFLEKLGKQSDISIPNEVFLQIQIESIFFGLVGKQ